VGSSNYGHRSQNRDLEAQALVVTMDPALRRQIRGEWDDLRAHAVEVQLKEFATPERRSTMRERVLAKLLKRWL
jgi:CDP-diacylglycerol--glycerol-3-phosphate 3-phosphatidyltransferase